MSKDTKSATLRKRNFNITREEKPVNKAQNEDYDKRSRSNVKNVHNGTFLSCSDVYLVFTNRIHSHAESLLSFSSGFQNYRGILNNCIVLLVRYCY